MKLIALFILITCMQAGASVLAQQVTLSEKDASMQKVLREIRRQSDVDFIFKTSQINKTKPVTIHVKNRPLAEVLDAIFSDQPVDYALDNETIIVRDKKTYVPSKPLTEAAQMRVSGTVTNTHGNPLAGISVREEGTNNGTVTSENGAFSLTLTQSPATLVFTSIGYVSQEQPAQSAPMNIVLEDDLGSIDEVVVVGYATQKKANLTGAVASISGERLENRSVPTLTQALQGTVANLNISTPNGAPGTRQNVNIRGFTGINIDDNGNRSNVSGAPLIVIDGVQGGDLSTINMNDVESVSVLKDAASAAIYGSSAPFGVIIITTKKGKAGKPLITYNNNFGFSAPTNLPQYVNSLDFALAFNEVGENSFYTAELFTSDVIQRIKDYQAGTLTEETIKNPSSDNWLGWNGANANNDWFDIYFKNASFSQQHNVGVSGGTENSSYYVGLGYNQQDGLYNFANDSYKRYNGRANLSSSLTSWLKFNFRGAFSRAETDNPTIYGNISGGSSYSYDYFHQLGRTYPTVPLRNPDGYWSEGSGVGIFTDGGRAKSSRDNAMLTGEFVVNLLPGWDFTANYTYDGTYIEDSNHRKTFYIVKPSGEQQPRGGSSPNYIGRNMYRNQHHTINAFTSYQKAFGDHNFNAILGYTQELYDDLRLNGSNDNLYSDEVPMISVTYGVNRNAADYASQLAIRGGFGRLNYNYQEKYLVELNGRYDGTSRFLQDVRYKFYPGISAAWVLSKESFWEPLLPYVNQFKLRGSYASLGDQAFTNSRYPFYPNLITRAPTDTRWLFNGGRGSSVANPGLINYDLTWITTNTLGFGVDADFLSNRLNVSFDWYRRQAKDFAIPGDALPAILGTSAPRINDAETETRGLEITVGWKDRVNEFSYGADLVLGDYTGKVVKVNNPTKLLDRLWYDGMTMGEIWGFETEGLFKSEDEISTIDQSFINANWFVGDVHYRDLDDNNEINIGNNTVDNPGDRRIIGNTTPRYSFGLNLNAAWKGFDITAFLQGVGKRDIMFDPGANFFWGFVSNEWQSSYFTVHTDRWTPDNPNGYFPRAYFTTDKNRRAQTRYLQNAAYLRVKNVQLGYTLPQYMLDKVNFKRARLFVNVENLATFTNLMKIVDPEIVNSNAKVYPVQRTWAFGLNVTF
ncbi:SusC/RagA family TonB-linked outer membrane protein [Parapedobacter sp. 2B3]|uniref:SusC/RagA family TonB-linked outer membrane protein n=1 Tax=Parapedobacter sp. 2B3 TaxID=3342381 RepID=UPI0035B60C06